MPDADHLQTVQLQAAIDALSAAGGGVLVLPAGIYRTGALHLKSGVELHLASPKMQVRFTPEDPEQNYPLVFSHWEASPCYNYSALLYACDAHDIAVTGTLDGGADKDHWWNWHHQVEDSWSEDKPDLQINDRRELRRMNEEGIPVKERVFGKGHFLRPNFVQFLRCERVLLQGVTLHNSPMWQLNPVQCKSVIVDGLTLSSHGSNNDGCDPESCSGVWIKNCCFDTGDDCISLKSGRDNDGRTANIPCEDVLIEHNEFADGHGGIALGSEMSSGIYRVLASENHFSSPNLTYALRLKTNARRRLRHLSGGLSGGAHYRPGAAEHPHRRRASAHAQHELERPAGGTGGHQRQAVPAPRICPHSGGTKAGADRDGLCRVLRHRPPTDIHVGNFHGRHRVGSRRNGRAAVHPANGPVPPAER